MKGLLVRSGHEHHRRVPLAAALVAGVIALFVVKPMIELPAGLGALAFVGMITVGAVLGNIVGGRLFNSSPKPPS